MKHLKKIAASEFGSQRELIDAKKYILTNLWDCPFNPIISLENTHLTPLSRFKTLITHHNSITKFLFDVVIKFQNARFYAIIALL